MPNEKPFELVLVGGGLQNALVAMALLARRPQSRFVIVERDSRLGGNHLWCFHPRDVPDGARDFVEPLVAHRWPAYDVAFPKLNRRMDLAYAGITSDRLHQVVTERVAASSAGTILHGVSVEQVSAHAITLADGRTLEGTLVVDSRGPERFKGAGRLAYQKFLGLEVSLTTPRPGFVPKLMDATVPQVDGYRFFYTLPFADDRFLIEDTYYSDTPDLDRDRLRQGILAYAQNLGLSVGEVLREETGVLPLTMHSEPTPARGGVLVGGYAGGWFHPTTGYTFPVALRLAMHISARAPEQVFGVGWDELLAHRQGQAGFFNVLNRMLFGAMIPESRWTVFERFYRLPDETIKRFYSMDLTMGDRVRLLVGRPPQGLSIRAALAQVLK
jgi:lycopene beta-cyclase